MIFGGFFNGVLIIGQTIDNFAVVKIDVEHLKEIKVDFGYCNSQKTVNNGMFYKRMSDIKRFVLGNGNGKLEMMIREVYKMGFDTDDQKQAIAYGYYRLAIFDYTNDNAEIKRKQHHRQTRIKFWQARQEEIKQRLKKAVNGLKNDFNFNNYNWHSAYNFQIPRKQFNSIQVRQAQKFGFKQVFDGGRLYINKKKQLLFEENGFLFPLYDNDYIIQEKKKNDKIK